MAERAIVGYPGSGESDPSNNNLSVTDRETTPGSEYDPDWASRFRRKVIVIGTAATALVAGATAAAVFAFGPKDSAEKQTGQGIPAATAGVAPGEGAAGPTPSTAETTAEPSQEATPVDMNTWDIDTFVYNIDGKKLTGVKALEAEYGIKVSENQTGKDAAKALIKNVNTWINSLDTANDKEDYAQYSPLTNGDDQLARGAGIAHDLAAPAWKQVLSTTELADGSAGVQDPGPWFDTMRGLHVQNIQDAAKQRNAGGKDNHYAGFKIRDINVLTTYQNETAFILNLTFTGPDRSVDVVLNATMRQVEGADGEKLWKIISLSDEEVK